MILKIGLSGPSCSGKTVISKHLREIFPDITVISQDDFYKPEDEIPVCDGITNWDCEEAFYMDRFVEKIKNLSNSGTEPNETDGIGGIDRLILVEGILIFEDETLLELLDLRIFLDADYDTCSRRRKERIYPTDIRRLDGSLETQFWPDPPDYFDKFVWPKYEQIRSKVLGKPSEPSYEHGESRKKDGKGGVSSGIERMVVIEGNRPLDQVLTDIVEILNRLKAEWKREKLISSFKPSQ